MTKNRGDVRPNSAALAALRARRRQRDSSKVNAVRASGGSGRNESRGGAHCSSRAKIGNALGVGSTTALRIALNASSSTSTNTSTSSESPAGSCAAGSSAGGGGGVVWDNGGEELRTVVRTTLKEMTASAADVRRPVVLPPREDGVSAFFSVTPAAVSVNDYVARVLRYAQCSSGAFLYAGVYLVRLQAVDGRLELNAYNMHRLLITAVMVAAKFVDDAWYSNAYYARVGGVATVAEMNKLEMQMLKLLNFRLLVKPEELHMLTKQSPILIARL